MSLKIQNFLFLVVFVSLTTITSSILWDSYNWRILPQMLLIILIALIGEHVVSSQGYYFYTRHERNGPFLRNVPMWIIFLWIFLIQASYIVSLLLGVNGLSACLLSGWFASLIDFLLLEPLMSRMMGLWLWTPVEKGYFGFIPSRLNRFTAPLGNYITWLLFPILANSFLGIMMILV